MDLMMINAHFEMMTDVGTTDRPDGRTQPPPPTPTPNPNPNPFIPAPTPDSSTNP